MSKKDGKAPAFQFYPQRFLASVSMWNANAVGVYIRLLSLQWDQGGLPNDLDQLTNAAGKDVPEVWPVVGRKFPVSKDGLLRNGMLEGIRKEQDEYRLRIGKARQKAASARWDAASKSTSDLSALASANASASAEHIGGVGKRKKSSGKERARPDPIEVRKEGFISACKAITDQAPERLVPAERRGFTDYWTEPSNTGRMRFEAEKFFDHGRRMDTWMANANKRTGHAPLKPEKTAERRTLKTTFDL